MWFPHRAPAILQETLEEGCKKIDDIVESFDDVGLRDRSMVWNTDLVEVGASDNPGCNWNEILCALA